MQKTVCDYCGDIIEVGIKYETFLLSTKSTTGCLPLVHELDVCGNCLYRVDTPVITFKLGMANAPKDKSK